MNSILHVSKARISIFRYHLTLLLLLPIFIFQAIPSKVFSQALPSTVMEQDTTGKKDSSYVPIQPMPYTGSLDRLLSPRFFLTDSEFAFTDYGYLGNLTAQFPGVYIRDLGSPGQLHGLTINGVDAHAVAVMSDGTLLNDPFTGVFDLNQYPTEHIERIEIVPATRAFLYSLNSTGGAINLVTKNYAAGKPVSRIRFTQTAFENTVFDGLVSQDVRKDLNVTIGLQHPAFGRRFDNSVYDAWNARFKVRYAFSEHFSIFASEIYNQTRLGLNGGIDFSTPEANRYERELAIVMNGDSYEKTKRHDIQLGLAAQILPESTSLTTVTLFHSTYFREYRDENPLLTTNAFFVQQDHRSQWFGARIGQHLSAIGNSIDLGAELQSRGVIASSVMNQYVVTHTSIWGKDEISLIPDFLLSGYARVDRNENSNHFSYGADVVYATPLGVELVGGFSRSYREPTVQEIGWQDSVVYSFPSSAYDVEAHNLVEAGINLTNSNIDLLLKYFKRTITNAGYISQPVVYNPFPQVAFDFSGDDRVVIEGIHSKAALKFGFIVAEGNLQYLQTKRNGTKLSELPQWSATGGVYFWDTLFNGHLVLKTGFRGKVISAHDGVEYNPQAQMYVPVNNWSVNSIATGDFVLHAHLGDADIHLIWENLFNRNYVIVPFFPMPDRSVRFGLNWVFLN